MDAATFASPELAAMVGFPPQYCHVVASRISGDDAYVLLNTGSPEHPYLYGVNCSRTAGHWCEGSSGNGPGWSLTDEERSLGTLSVWGDVPADADMVRVEYDGDVLEEPVVERTYLAVWWRTPAPDDDGPRVTAFRIAGNWMNA